MLFPTILLLGCGAIGRATLAYWNRIIPHVTYNQFIIIDQYPVPPEIVSLLPNTIFKQLMVTQTNFIEILSRIDPDLIVDLSTGIDSMDLINYCQDHDICYLNTSMETWPSESHYDPSKDPYKYSLVLRHDMALYNNKRTTFHPTALVEHGMNPGLISHFAKWGLQELAQRENILSGPLNKDTYAEMAKRLNVHTIQVSEIDTQLANIPFNMNTFFNTWSSVGFYEEATEPAQLGWGTHEIPIPGAFIDKNDGILRERGMNVQVRGYEPTRGYYTGYCIPHGEANSLSKYLSTEDYNPSVYYVYKPSAIAEQSLRILREHDYEMPPFYYVLTSNDIRSGYDAVGALFLRPNKPAFWAGTIVDHKTVPDFVNATCVQVVAGVLAGIDYIDQHRTEGVIFPEQVDTTRVFDLLIPFLGTIFLDYVPAELPTQFRDLIIN